MITIPQELRRAIEQAGGQPMHLDDPATGQSYVLMKADVYERLQTLFEREDRQSAEEMFPGIREVFEDWSDPAMDVYNDMDPRK